MDHTTQPTNEQAASTACSRCEVFASLETLRRDSRVGPAVRDCFVWLLHFAGGRPAYLVVTTKRIAYDFGVDRRAVEKWIAKLAEFGLIEVIDRDKRRGVLHLYIFHPRPERREPRPDPQRHLALDLCAPESAPKGPALDLCAPKGLAGGGETSTCAPKGLTTRIIPACARVSSLLSSPVDDDMTAQWPQILQAAHAARKDIFGHRPRAALDFDGKCFLATACAVAELLTQRDPSREWSGWLTYSIAVTARAKVESPIRYLRSTLRNNLVEYLGLCNTPDDAKATLGQILAAVRPSVKRLLATRRAGESPATPPEAGHFPGNAVAADAPAAADRLPKGSMREIAREVGLL